MLYTRPHRAKLCTSAVEHCDARLSWRKDTAQIIPQAKYDQCSPGVESVNWRFRYLCWRSSTSTTRLAEKGHVPTQPHRVSDQQGGAGLGLRDCRDESEDIIEC
jgi:hypothetical protein